MGRLSDSALDGELFLPRKTAKQLTRRTDPRTSYEAADGVIHKLRATQIRVLNELKKAGSEGLTDFDLEEICQDHGSNFRTRRSELVDVGLVVDSGRTKIQKGSRRIVWIAAEYAK